MKKINGYALMEELRYSTCGQMARASKGRQVFLLKIFQNPVAPSSIMDEKTYAAAQARFEEHKRRKTLLNERMRKISGAGGNIVAPVEEFLHDGRWVEATHFLSDAVAPDQVLHVFNALDRDAKIMALKSMAASYVGLHGERIVHGDAKLSNAMLRRNSSGHYVFAIIDFDGAFLETDVPVENIVASLEYFSPEMAVYSSMDVEARKDKASLLTTGHDVFCLGLIFHQLLTGGKFPIPDELPPHLEKRRADGKPVYLYTAMMASDADHHYQAQIAPEVEPGMAALISKMLAADAGDRPSAEQVLSALNVMLGTEDLELPDAPFIWNRDQLMADGYTRVEAVERYGREGYLLSGFGRSRFMVSQRLLELGYVRGREDSHFEESICAEADERPWAEDRIVLNEDALLRKKMVVSRAVRNGIRGYRLQSEDGTIRFVHHNTLRLLGLARGA